MVFEESESLELEPLMNEITEEIFYDFLYMQNNIIDLIEEKTKELSMILHDRLPEGEICWVDICESEFRSECIFVEFEGSCCKDQYNLPMRFLYDKDYPSIFKTEHEYRTTMLEEMDKLDKEREERERLLNIEKMEREEYERLKSKYE